MVEVKVIWLDSNGDEKIEHFGEFGSNADAINNAVRHCLDDYDKSGKQIEKNIIKVEIEDVPKIRGMWNNASTNRRAHWLTFLCGNGIAEPANMEYLIEKQFDELNVETKDALIRLEMVAKQIIA